MPPTDRDFDITAMLENTGALKQGHFRLSSGLHSLSYVQCALLLQWPEVAKSACAALARRFDGTDIDIVVGPAVGAIVVAHETARALACRAVFTERRDDAMTLRRGFSLKEGEKVLLVEDVVTTGGSTREVMEVITRERAEVIGVASLINRAGGNPFDCRFESLLTLDIPTHEEADCPLCAAGQPIDAPGSRQGRRS